MKITYDTAKRQKTLADRGLDFEEAIEVFLGPIFEIEDTRFDYGETRMLCFGLLHGRMVTVGYVQRNDSRHVFTMRKANDREKKKFQNKLV